MKRESENAITKMKPILDVLEERVTARSGPVRTVTLELRVKEAEALPALIKKVDEVFIEIYGGDDPDHLTGGLYRFLCALNDADPEHQKRREEIQRQIDQWEAEGAKAGSRQG